MNSNAKRRKTQPWQMQGYHETRGHFAACVHHTKSILPVTTPNVKEKSRKNQTDSPLTTKPRRDKILSLLQRCSVLPRHCEERSDAAISWTGRQRKNFINMRMWWNWGAMGALPEADKAT